VSFCCLEGCVSVSKHNLEQIILIDTSVVGLLFTKFGKRKYHLPLIIHLLCNTPKCLLSYFEEECSKKKIQIYEFLVLDLRKVLRAGKIS